MKALLIVLGFPLWFSLLLAFVAIVLALSVALWSIVSALWAVLISLVAAAPGGIVTGVLNFISGNAGHGIILVGIGIASVCLVIPVFYICKYSTKGCAIITARCYGALANIFRR